MRLSVELLASWLEKSYALHPVNYPETTLWVDLPAFLTEGRLAEHGLYVLAGNAPCVSPEASACVVDCNGTEQGAPLPVGCRISLAQPANERAVMDCLLDCFRHYGEWMDRLFRAASSKSLETMAEICSELSDNLFIITDMMFRPLAAASAGRYQSASSIERLYGLHLEISERDISFIRSAFDVYRGRTEPYGFSSIETIDGTRLPLVTQNLWTNRTNRLGNILFLATAHQLTPCEAHILTLAAPFVEQALLVHSGAPLSETGYLFQAVTTMLEGKPISPEMVAQAEAAAGFSGMAKRCYVVYMPTTTVDELSKFYSNRLISALHRGLIVPQGEELLVIAETSSPASRQSGDVVAMETFLAEMELYAGASDPFLDMNDLMAYYTEARMAGRFVHEIPEHSRIHFFADYRLPFLLSSCVYAVPNATFLPPELALVFDYNRTAAVDYVKTLQVFFEEGGNTAACARRLGISRNTLLPRLERLRTLLGSDLADPQERFLLELCLKLKAMSAS